MFYYHAAMLQAYDIALEVISAIHGNAQSIDNACRRDYTGGEMEALRVYKSNWWGFIAKRVLIASAVFLLFTVAVFSTYLVSPLHPSAAYKYIIGGPSYPIETNHELEQKYHSCEPYVLQYFYWLGNFFTGNWDDCLLIASPYAK
jgi:hypothetical protein